MPMLGHRWHSLSSSRRSVRRTPPLLLRTKHACRPPLRSSLWRYLGSPNCLPEQTKVRSRHHVQVYLLAVLYAGLFCSVVLLFQSSYAQTRRPYELYTPVYVTSHPPCRAKPSVLLSSEQSRLRTHICPVCKLRGSCSQPFLPLHARFCDSYSLLWLVCNVLISYHPITALSSNVSGGSGQTKIRRENLRNISTAVTLSTSGCHFRCQCHSAALLQVDRAVAGTCARTQRAGPAISSSQLSGPGRSRSRIGCEKLRANRTWRSQNRNLGSLQLVPKALT